jgi:hypothetical protein
VKCSVWYNSVADVHRILHLFCQRHRSGVCPAVHTFPSAHPVDVGTRMLFVPSRLRTQWKLVPTCCPRPPFRVTSGRWSPHVVHVLPFAPAFSTRLRTVRGSCLNSLAFPLTPRPIPACARSCFRLRPHHLRGPPPQTTRHLRLHRAATVKTITVVK